MCLSGGGIEHPGRRFSSVTGKNKTHNTFCLLLAFRNELIGSLSFSVKEILSQTLKVKFH